MNAREINELTRDELEALHDDMLDEIYEPYKMGELTFDPSDILKSCDPVAYRCSVSDYEDSLLRDAEEEEDEG